MTGASEPHPITGELLGLPVDATPAQRPTPVTLEGRYGHVERLAHHHDAAMWNAVKGHDHIWTYMSYGPLADFAAFSKWLAGRVKLDDPYSYAIIDRSGQAVGIATLMEIRPAMRVVEVGNILYSPCLQRTPLGTEAQFPACPLCVRDARLSPLRMEVQRAQRAVAPRGITLWLCVRGHPAPAHDRERQEPRHRLFLDARQRVADAQGCLRALARAGEFRRAGTPADKLERVERRALDRAARALPSPAKRGEGFTAYVSGEQTRCTSSSPAQSA
jgi:RimJ/RimL family protein N-acetyltransferase